MPTNKAWTINCVLFGAKIGKLLQEGKEDEARVSLRKLTYEFEPGDVEYIIKRLKENGR